MSRDYWKLEEDLCRCCHSEGTFQNLAGAYNFDDEEEIYFNMLRETFDLNITPVSGSLCAATYTICDACITRLRDASSFKRQVIRCEQKFHQMYGGDFIRIAESDCKVEVKVEGPERDTENAEEFTQVVDEFADSLDSAHGDYHDDDDGDHNKIMFDKQRILFNRKQYENFKTRREEEGKENTAKGENESETKKTAQEMRPTAQDSSEKPVTSKLEQLLTQGGKVRKFRLREDDYTKDGDSYRCARCDKHYDKLFSLKFHVKTKHYKIPRFVCPYCPEEFMTPAPLTVHKLQQHSVDDRFKCNACKGTFNTKVQLRKHINNFHMLGEKYKCEFCEYESFSFEGMYKHKFKHKTVKDYHCRFCRKSFLRKTTLDLHERIHTGDRRKVCAVCGQAFVQKASLNYHMNKYHPEVNF
ncbi:hypothetical protein O3G_MSEX011876 [Manduca sexta]|uniref:Uncharacterized protein n=1 Tax=Manduca sexta TaxID=7130 RepID=A0A921ZN15_MANSE|nr:hypothetical protein O3G_MSEX011876 [Manduca sexta]